MKCGSGCIILLEAESDGLYPKVILLFMFETAPRRGMAFVSHHSCYYGYSLFTLVTHVWFSVHPLTDNVVAMLYIGYTIGCFNNNQNEEQDLI